MRTRHAAQTKEDIADGIRLVKAHAREDLESIHLLPCDFKVVEQNPASFGLTPQEDGSLVTTFHGRLIPVLAHKT